MPDVDMRSMPFDMDGSYAMDGRSTAWEVCQKVLIVLG
jgi:hypothetical protein